MACLPHGLGVVLFLFDGMSSCVLSAMFQLHIVSLVLSVTIGICTLGSQHLSLSN